MDVLKLYQEGFKNVAATLGTALTEDHVRILKRYTSNILMIYDSDEAGINAVLRNIEMFLKQGIFINILTFTTAKDPDEFLEKMKAISLNKQRANAVSVLIDDNLLHEAESLLNLIDSKYSQGKKEVLAGYILALQGECDKSNEMFDRALIINPIVCVPDSYRKICN